MTETLYPHEQIIKILNVPNTLFESLSWILFSAVMFIMQILIARLFDYIVFKNNIDVLQNQSVIIMGFDLDILFTLILLWCGIAGLIQKLDI